MKTKFLLADPHFQPFTGFKKKDIHIIYMHRMNSFHTDLLYSIYSSNPATNDIKSLVTLMKAAKK